ncbi:hypothetical protein PspLS_03466 [Pyricularia sp. CBS 133598]|nr:hypothetical protein PspLS_03466 [Pyricularia sp. CBS 133598]
MLNCPTADVARRHPTSSTLEMLLDKQHPEAPAAAAFVDCVSRLQNIIWKADSVYGRAFIGLRQSMPHVGAHFNHSMPIRGASPRFHLVGPDPRLVGPELKQVEMLERWDIRQVRPTKERVLFAYTPHSSYPEGQVWDAKTANDFLKGEENEWIKTQLWHYTIVRGLAGRVPIEGPNELANATRPAIGFWLFPLEALRDDGEGVTIGGSTMVFYLTGHWPELALSHLS